MNQRLIELEVIPGLERLAVDEVSEVLGSGARVLGSSSVGQVAVSFSGELASLARLRSVAAAHVVLDFDVPRPQALLGHQHFTLLARTIRLIVGENPSEFANFRISAAGSGSSTFGRLKQELATALDLPALEGEADLLLRVRRRPGQEMGWQVLIRTTPRPFSKRPWRVCDMPGALNATVANVMVRLAHPRPDERFLNIACGSATLLIERLEVGPAALAVGCDVSDAALACARQNLRASGRASSARLMAADGAQLPVKTASIDTVVADLPFGMLAGTGVELGSLYSAVLREADRVGVPGAALVVITNRRTLFRSALTEGRTTWRLDRELAVKVPFPSGTFEASIFVARKRAT